jgi:hypothetical protein
LIWLQGGRRPREEAVKNAAKWILFILLLLLIYFGWRWWTGSSEDEARANRGDPALLFDRVWMDHIPESRVEFVHFMIALSDHPIGLFQKSSEYRVEAEFFAYSRAHSRKGGALKVHFPQTRAKKSFAYEVRACDDLPPFDLCLDLSKNPWGGPKRYYGMSDDRAMLGALSQAEIGAWIDRVRAERLPAAAR